MGNPLFDILNNQQPQQPTGPFSNLANVINQFNQFQSTFQGDPRQKVQELLNSGQMTQEQYNQLSIMAQTFQQLLHR